MSNPAWIVIDVKPNNDYTLQLTFADGKQGIFDASCLLDKPINKPLNDPAFFMRARVEYGTVVWNDDIDIAPEYLYEQCITTGGMQSA